MVGCLVCVLLEIYRWYDPGLDECLSESIDSYISENEIHEVLKIMKNNKFPGSDRYTVEFFKLCLVKLKEII